MINTQLRSEYTQDKMIDNATSTLDGNDHEDNIDLQHDAQPLVSARILHGVEVVIAGQPSTMAAITLSLERT